METLARKNTRRNIRKALLKLPEEIDGVYREAMQTIERQSPEDTNLAKKVLLWTTFAVRPLNIQELQRAVAIELEDKELYEDALPPEDLLQSVCAGLICIGSERNTVRLVRYTTRNYFARFREHYFPDSIAYMTKVCLRYASLSSFSKPVPFEELSRFALYKCVAEHLLLRHPPESQDMDDEFKSLALNFLEGPEHMVNMMNYMQHCHMLPRMALKIPLILPTPHVATWVGFKKLLVDMIKPKGDVDVDSKDTYGQTVAMYAAYFGRASILRALVDSRAALRTSGTHVLISELHHAAGNGYHETVKIILESGVAPNGPRDQFGQNALIHSLRANGNRPLVELPISLRKTKMIALLLEHGADINFKDHLGRHALIHAVTLKLIETIPFLLENGADVNLCSDDGMSALSIAAQWRQEYLIKYLCSHSAKLEGSVPHLFSAISSGQIELVCQSLKSGADVNCAYGEDLHLPLQHAIDCVSDTNIVNLLLSCGAKPDLINSEGYTPLHYAVMEGKEDVFALLMKYTAQVDVEDVDGWTPLRWAVSDRGHERILQMLLENGACQLNRADLYGRTALHWAVRFSYDGAIIRQLVQNGADQLVRDNEGNTALTYAVERGLSETVNILLESLNGLDCNTGTRVEVVESARLHGLAYAIHVPGERAYTEQVAESASIVFKYLTDAREDSRPDPASQKQRNMCHQQIRIKNLIQLEKLKAIVGPKAEYYSRHLRQCKASTETARTP